MKDAYEQGLLSGRMDRKLENPCDPNDRNPYSSTDLKWGAFDQGYKKGYEG